MVQIPQLHLQHGGLEGIEAGIDAHQFVIVAIVAAVETELGEEFGQGGVVGGDHAGVAVSAEILARIEAETTDGADGAAAAAFVFRANGLGGVFDNHGAVTAGDVEEGVHVGGAAEEVDGLDGPDVAVAGEGGFDLVGVEVEGVGIDVDKDWLNAEAGERAGGGEEAVGSGDDLVAGAEFEGHPGEQEGVRARSAADGVAGLGIAGDGAFEFADGGAHDETLGVDEGDESGEDFVAEGGVLGGEVQEGDVPLGRLHTSTSMIDQAERGAWVCETVAMDYRWKPIALWTEEARPWSGGNLRKAWEQVIQASSADQERVWRKRLAREWSIETGQIEGAFDIPRGVTMELLRDGYVAALIGRQPNGVSEERVVAMLEDAEAALELLFAFVKSERQLTVGFIRELHQLLVRHVETRDVWVEVGGERRLEKRPLRKGEYKQEANSPHRPDGSQHEYCPPLQVAAEMDRLVELYHAEAAPQDPLVKAAWLHHAFTQIHPFEDGNGRVARALASLELIRAGLPPLTVYREMTGRYYDALLEADLGRPQALVDLVESCLFRVMVQAWHEVEPKPVAEVPPSSSLDDVLAYARERLAQAQGAPGADFLQPVKVVETAWQAAGEELQRYSDKLNRELKLTAGSDVVQFSHTTYFALAESVAKLESWGDEISLVNVRAFVLDLPPKKSSQVVLLLDEFSEKRKGLAALSLGLMQEQKLERVWPSFFLCRSAEDQGFRQWLEQGMTEAMRRWAQSL